MWGDRREDCSTFVQNHGEPASRSLALRVWGSRRTDSENKNIDTDHERAGYRIASGLGKLHQICHGHTTPSTSSILTTTISGSPPLQQQEPPLLLQPQAPKNQNGSRHQDTDSETLKHYMGQYHTANLGTPTAHPPKQDLSGKIRAAHLLVKHRDSRRPSSWREAQITRSQDDAMGVIRGYEQRIRGGSTSSGRSGDDGE